MAYYTTQLRSICESYAGMTVPGDYDDIDAIIAKASPFIFKNYPIFDEQYRSHLNESILRHYYMQEIGFETVGLWKLYLNRWLSENMPYYNKLYESINFEYDPLTDVNYTVTRTEESNGEMNKTDTVVSSGKSDSNETNSRSIDRTKDETGKTSDYSVNSIEGTNTTDTTQSSTAYGSGTTKNSVVTSESESGNDLYSDTPQGSLTNVVNGDYLTNARRTDNEKGGSSETSGNTTNTENSTGHSAAENKTTSSSINSLNSNNTASVIEHDIDSYISSVSNNDKRNTESMGIETTKNVGEVTESRKGKIGSTLYSDMLVKYRESLINVDMMIINALQPLFIGLWE